MRGANTLVRKSYSSDLTADQWAILEPMFPANTGRGRRQTIPIKDIIDAVFYINASGCKWEDLPHDFPQLATCLNPSQLSRSSDGLLCVSESSGAIWQGSPGQRGLGLLRQGSLERSNSREEDDIRLLRAIAAIRNFSPATAATEPQ